MKGSSIIRSTLHLSFLFSAQIVSAQTSQGCFKADTSLTSQGSYLYQSVGNCLTECSGKQNAVLALTAGDECLCGNSLPAGGMVASSNCDLTCTGYPSDTCGGSGFYSVWLTGVGNLLAASNAASSSSKSSTTQAATTTTPPASFPSVITITTAVQGSTITQTLSAARATASARTSAAAARSQADISSGSSGISGGAIAGIVIGILAAAAIIGAIIFLIVRKRRRREDENPFAGEYKRQIEPSSGTQVRPNPVFDSRLQPNLAVGRNSLESLADDQDYSRRKVLRVVN